MTVRESATEYFKKGYNCSQSVVSAFADRIPGDRETLIRLSSAFGGGMGRLREVCGAVTGMFMIAGILYGYEGPEAGKTKAELYERIRELAASFRERNGSIICRELLGEDGKNDGPVPEERTEEYYEKRPCAELVGDAAEILDRFIAAHPF